VSVTLSAVAQIAFKFGVSSDPGDGARALLGPLAKLVTPGVLVGLGLYAIGTILRLTALGRVDLSPGLSIRRRRLCGDDARRLVAIRGSTFH
jgi:hypothetical protein